jgi:hypothetical protein
MLGIACPAWTERRFGTVNQGSQIFRAGSPFDATVYIQSIFSRLLDQPLESTIG